MLSSNIPFSLEHLRYSNWLGAKLIDPAKVHMCHQKSKQHCFCDDMYTIRLGLWTTYFAQRHVTRQHIYEHNNTHTDTTLIQIQQLYRYDIYTNTTPTPVQQLYRYNIYTNTTSTQVQLFLYFVFYYVFVWSASYGPFLMGFINWKLLLSLIEIDWWIPVKEKAKEMT
jgi:hypothetical protein